MIVEVFCPSLFRTYLLFSAIHVLEEQGGRLLDRNYVPKWVGKKWKDKKWWNIFMIL